MVLRVPKFFRRQAQPLNGGLHPWPFFMQEALAFGCEQQITRSAVDKHPESSPALDEALVHQLLISLEDREVIDAIFRRDVAHRGQGIALFEHAFENHRDHAVAKLAVNRLTVIPLAVHWGFPLLGALQVEVSDHGLVSRPKISPLLDVMIGVDHGELCVLHVTVLQIAAHVEKIELDRLAV